MNGRRYDLTEWSWTAEDTPKSGDYGKRPDGVWYCIPPGLDSTWMGNLNAHTVVEHEDGTITVSPSILISSYKGHSWHGYLERGVWREA